MTTKVLSFAIWVALFSIPGALASESSRLVKDFEEKVMNLGDWDSNSPWDSSWNSANEAHLKLIPLESWKLDQSGSKLDNISFADLYFVEESVSSISKNLIKYLGDARTAYAEKINNYRNGLRPIKACLKIALMKYKAQLVEIQLGKKFERTYLKDADIKSHIQELWNHLYAIEDMIWNIDAFYKAESDDGYAIKCLRNKEVANLVKEISDSIVRDSERVSILKRSQPDLSAQVKAKHAEIARIENERLAKIKAEQDAESERLQKIERDKKAAEAAAAAKVEEERTRYRGDTEPLDENELKIAIEIASSYKDPANANQALVTFYNKTFMRLNLEKIKTIEKSIQNVSGRIDETTHSKILGHYFYVRAKQGSFPVLIQILDLGFGKGLSPSDMVKELMNSKPEYLTPQNVVAMNGWINGLKEKKLPVDTALAFLPSYMIEMMFKNQKILGAISVSDFNSLYENYSPDNYLANYCLNKLVEAYVRANLTKIDWTDLRALLLKIVEKCKGPTKTGDGSWEVKQINDSLVSQWQAAHK